MDKPTITFMLAFGLFSLTTGGSCPAASSDADILHVSADAPAGGDGSPARPFRSPLEARDFLRGRDDAQKQRSVHVRMAPGIYHFEEPMEFLPRDGGSGDGVVSYESAGKGKVVWSGGRRLTGWEPFRDGIWKTRAGDPAFRQLYIDGQKAVRARHPNRDEFFRIERPEIEKRRVLVPGEFLDRWQNFDHVEMHATMLWAEGILRLRDFEPVPDDPELSRLSFREPESSLAFQRQWPRFVPNQAFHLENALEFVDQPGEWYLDPLGVCYLLPPGGGNPNEMEITAPVAAGLVRIAGSPGDPVRGLAFQGITFSHTNWLRPSGMGHLHLQAGQFTIEPTLENNQYVGRIPAAVTANNARNLRFTGNVFTHLGNHALDFHEGVKDSIIEGNIFYDLSASAIVLGEFSPPEMEIHTPWNPGDERLVTSDILVANNYIREIGTDYPGSCGIAAGYVSDVIIEHNELCNLPYTGISVGWGWTREPTPLRNNIIRRNHVHSLMRDLTDGGGIYTLSLQPGTVIEENFVDHAMLTPKSHDPHSLHSRGIYLDEATGGTEEEPFVVRRNLVRRSTQDFREHITGLVVLDSPLNYLELTPHMSQRPAGSEIAAVAGLQPEYQALKKSLPFTPFDLAPSYREILSRRQKELRDLTGTTQQIIMTTELRDDPRVIGEYEHLHSRDGIWKEVVEAAKISGIEKIKIHRWKNRLVMIIDLPKGVNADEVFSAYDNSSPRVKEWAEKMKTLQTHLPGEPQDTTWQPMKTIHDYEYGTVR